MSKLQLYISKSTKSRVSLVGINGDSVIGKYVADMQPVVALVDYPMASKTVFYAVRNVQGGYFIHIIRTIPPTRPYHLDAAIFVGEDVDILADELADVIAVVTEKVLASAVTEADMQELNELFATDYDARDKFKRIKPSKGSDVAFLRYGDSVGVGIDEIISDGLYRQQWSGYKAVLLIDGSIDMLSGSAVDLDADGDEPAEEMPQDLEPRKKEKQTKPEQQRIYMFSLPMLTPDGRTSLEFEIESSKPVSRSPIPGYDIPCKLVEGADAVNQLRRSHGEGLYGRLGRWLWGVCGMALGMFVMLVASWFGGSTKAGGDSYGAVEIETVASVKSDKTADAKPTKSVAAQPVEVSPQMKEAVAYLDKNRIWCKDDMEKIDGLHGLFDDMNNFRFDLLSDKWAKDLAGSKSYVKIANAAAKAISKKVDPRRSKDHNPCYNREGDTCISWLGYTYWIDP